MDKNVLKKFAIESRRELMKKMDNKIKSYYIDEELTKSQTGDIVLLSNDKHSLSLSKEEYNKRQTLIDRIKELGLEQVIEESAYTWFNRIVAIRYMEIHDYLPLTKDNQSLGIRVLSSKDNTPDPEILKFTNLTNQDLDIDFKKEKYAELKTDNDKFKYVLLLVCKKLGKVIPQVFDGVTDYIDILIPDNLLNDTGFVNEIVKEVPEDNFNEVEIIGWLYQYYISEKKDEVFADLKKNIKIKKENVPSATQIFTPDWIVKYMVENTLGRYTSENFRRKLKYYVKNKDEKIEEKEVEKIKFLDPCCGSGHILVYAFELFYEIYKDYGYSQNEIAEKILKNNIFGLDVDERASQLSILALLLKAREYDKNIFNKNIVSNLNIMSIQESNNVNQDLLHDIYNENNKEIVNYVLDSFKDAKEYGSILSIEHLDYNSVVDIINKVENIFSFELNNKVMPLFKQAIILSNKYDVVVTNPPYMGSRGMDTKLTTYVKKFYNEYKTDMFSVFIKRAKDFTKENGYYAMITQPTFLFLSSFQKIRSEIIDNETIISLLHMGRGIFGVDFGSTSFIIKNGVNQNYLGSYYRLNKRTFQYIEISDIEKIFLNAKDNINYTFDFNNYNSDEPMSEEENDEGILKIKYMISQRNFAKIPGVPFAYWISQSLINDFEGKNLNDYANIITGMTTGDNDKFLKLWYEINYNNIDFYIKDYTNINLEEKYWYPYSKGGNRKKWFGNYDYIVDWSKSGDFNRSKTTLKELYFKKAITWPFISSGKFSARILDEGFLWDVAGSPCFVYDDNLYKYILAFLNTKIADEVLKLINPTINVQAVDLMKLPILIDGTKLSAINVAVSESISISKQDWDSFEISWNFEKHPLIIWKSLKPDYADEEIKYDIESAFEEYKSNANAEFNVLKQNEEELNKIFIDIYGLQDELTPEESDKDVTIHKIFDSKEDIPEEMQNSQYALTKLDVIKSFISYAVGCMFGRYSLDENGLVYAGGEFDSSKYKTFEADADNIIPITENKYFEDDIVTKFVKFIEVVYGKNTLEENLDFIADTLGKRTAETSRDTIRRYFLNDFYADHLKTYQKRPIYWLFDSGKKNGFKALIYMHRYNDQTVSKIRLDYLHKMQQTYATELKDIEYKLNNNPTLSEKKELTKKQADLNAKILETNEYDEKVAHIADQRISIDLDDGVAVNYGKFSVKNPKTGKDESILANSKEIIKKTKNSKEE